MHLLLSVECLEQLETISSPSSLLEKCICQKCKSAYTQILTIFTFVKCHIFAYFIHIFLQMKVNM